MPRDLRNLPAEVMARITGYDSPAFIVQRGALLEGRRRPVELRQGISGAVRVVGYATTWETPYDVHGGPPWGWTEVMAAGSWERTLRERDDIRLLINHDNVPLARTRSGTLTAVADELGLLIDAELDPASPQVQTVRSALERGDIDQMSCAFEVISQEWSPDFATRRITEVKGWDVSIVTYPANEATMALVGARQAAAPSRQTRSVDLARRELELIRR